MYLGRIVEAGPTEEVLAAPRTPTRRPCCRWCRRSNGSSRWCSPARSRTRRHIPTGCRFHPRCPALADGRAAAAGVDRPAGRAARGAAGGGGARRGVSSGAPHEEVSRHERQRRGGPGGLQAALPREMYVDPDAWLRERDLVLFGEWFCVGRLDDLGLDRAGPGRGRRRRRRVRRRHQRRRRPPCGVQRLPAPRLAAVPARARRRDRLRGRAARSAAPTTPGPTASTAGCSRRRTPS